MRLAPVGTTLTARMLRPLSWLVGQDLPPAIAALAVYLRTLAPSVHGFDSAELATGAYSLGIVHPTGYPLYLLIAKLFTYIPLRNVAYRVNLLSAVAGALTVWLAIKLARRIGAERWAAWLAGGLLAFSYGFWSMSVVAEVYTLHAVLIAASLLLLDRALQAVDQEDEPGATRWLAGLSLCFGLSLTNHVSAALLAPAIILPWLRRGRRRAVLRRLPAIGVGFVLGLTPYVYLPMRYAADAPLNYIRSYYDVDLTTVQGLWWMVSGQAYRFFAFGYGALDYLRELLQVAGDLWRNLTGLGALLGFLGVVRLVRLRGRLAGSLLLGFAATVLFFAGYAVADKSNMLLAAWLMWSAWIAVGASWLMRVLAERIEMLGLPKVSGASVAGKLVLLCSVPIVMLANYRWLDLSQTYGAEHYAKQVLHSVPQDAVVMGPWSSAVILEYFQQVEGLRPDVQVFNRSRYEVAEYYKHWSYGTPHSIAIEFISRSVSQYVDEALGQAEVYDLEYEPRLAAQFEYQPIGRLFHLSPKDPG